MRIKMLAIIVSGLFLLGACNGQEPNVEPTASTSTTTPLPPTETPKPTETQVVPSATPLPPPTATIEAFDPLNYPFPPEVEAVESGIGWQEMKGFEVVQDGDTAAIMRQGIRTHTWNTDTNAFEATPAFFEVIEAQLEIGYFQQSGIANWSEKPGKVYETIALKDGMEIPMLTWRQGAGVIKMEKSLFESHIASIHGEEHDKLPFTMPVPINNASAKFLNEIALKIFFRHTFDEAGSSPKIPKDWKNQLYTYLVANGDASFSITARDGSGENPSIPNSSYVDGANPHALVEINIFGIEPYTDDYRTTGHVVHDANLTTGEIYRSGSIQTNMQGELVINVFIHSTSNGDVDFSNWLGDPGILAAGMFGMMNYWELRPDMTKYAFSDAQISFLESFCGFVIGEGCKDHRFQYRLVDLDG